MIALFFSIGTAFSADCFGDIAITVENPAAFEYSVDDGTNTASALIGLLPGVSAVTGLVLPISVASDGLRHAAALVRRDLEKAGVAAQVWLGKKPARSGWKDVGGGSLYVPSFADVVNDMAGDTPVIMVHLREPAAASRALRARGTRETYGSAANQLALSYLGARLSAYGIVGEAHSGAGYCR